MRRGWGFRAWSFELRLFFVPCWTEGVMARRTFSMVDVAEILEHWYAGRPKAEVARSLGVDVKTVRKYVAAAEAAGLAAGGPPVSAERWRGLARGGVPEAAGVSARPAAGAGDGSSPGPVRAAL